VEAPGLSRPLTHRARVGGAALRCLLVLPAVVVAALLNAPAAAAVTADFTWSPNPPIVEQEAVFTAIQDPQITSYWWDLDGDGAYNGSADKTGLEVSRTFHSVRTYRIGLLVSDDQGNSDETVQDVTVVAPGNPGPNSPPDASFVFFPAAPVVGEPITFVSTSTDPDSPIASSALRWDLNGDGLFDDAAGPSVTTSYATPGTYTISLQVTTNSVDVATLVLNVGVPGAPGTGVGQRSVSMMSPFPVVRIAGRVSRRGARIRRLTIDAPPGAGVRVSCAGRSCPFKRVLKTVSSRLRAGVLPATRLLRIRRLEGRLLRPGATLRLFVTRADSIGKYTRFKIRRGKSPARSDMCLVPGSGRPLVCPAG
jgi:PKD domain